MFSKLRSRKLWIAILTQALVVLIVAVLDIPEEQATIIVGEIVGTAGAYLLGQGIADKK
mgnify:CR=1 FL=1